MEDYPRAARRRLADATVLNAGKRYDGAANLAGYVVECSLKALIAVDGDQVERIHDLPKLRDTLTCLVRYADARTARIAEPLIGLLRSYGILGWHPQMRYRPSVVGPDQAQKWVAEASAIYAAAIGEMTMDGAI